MNKIIYNNRKRVQVTFNQKTRTKQSFKDECNINNILAKYQKTGALTHLNNNAPNYGFATTQDFTQSMQIVTQAQTMFEELPSSLRTKFHNNPAEFLEFVQDPKNDREMITLGLKNEDPNPSIPKRQKERTPASEAEIATNIKKDESPDE